ncbi:MAG: lipoprotein-releasing ABC transporter permease subunit [Deltaproteobacteria bacterium]|nr:lipoprotein-releasing ABC transporter permease subunit [Deltaproteobacteria bacterium]
MPYELFVGLRYLKAKRKQTFISIITFISVAGVAVGVMALIIGLSVMGGFQEEVKSKILGINAHVLILELGGAMEDYRRVQEIALQVPGVVAATPMIDTQIMLTAEGGVSGAVLRGIEPASVGRVTSLPQAIRQGSLADLQPRDGLPGILLGRDLARRLGTFPGDVVTAVLPTGGTAGPLGMIPRLKRLRVAGIFDIGYFEYDAAFAYVALPEAQAFLNLGNRVTGVEVKVADIYRAREISRAIRDRLGHPYWTRDWTEMSRNLFAALKLEKIGMFIIMTLTVLVAAFNIISTLIMVVMEKGKDIAILKSMGATPGGILRIFMIEGLVIGLGGTLLGLLGGYVGCRLLAEYQFIKLPTDVYFISALPVRLEWVNFLAVSGAAVALSFLATIYPSWQAARLDPAEALRYE